MKKILTLAVVFVFLIPLFSVILPRAYATLSLTNGYVDPGSAPVTTTFYYYATYYDSRGYAPEMGIVKIDGSNGQYMTLYNGIPSNGVYRYGTTLAVGTHNYYFYFNAGGSGGTVYLGTPSSPFSGPIVTPAQRLLTVSCAHDSPNPPNGNWHFDDGQYIACTVTSPVTEGSTVWTCTGLTATGSVPHSGTGTSTGYFYITHDSSITWNWGGSAAPVTLTVSSAHGNPVPGTGPHTYNSGDPVTCSVASPVIEGNTRWDCTGWTGTGSVQSSGSGTSTSFTITQGSSITWNWGGTVVHYTLTVNSDHDSPLPSAGPHIYSDGDPVVCSVTSPVTVGNTEWTCTGWTGTGSVPSSGTGTSTGTFAIHQDSSITWYWIISNHLPSTPSAPEWDPSTPAEILHVGWQSIFRSSATDPDNDQVQIVFDWGDGTKTTSDLKPSGTVIPEYHSWSRSGMFEVKAKAIDANGAESGWSPSLEVTVVQDEIKDVWGGYMVASLFPVVTISVEGEWNYPNYGSNPLFSAQGTWIGIGGNGSDSKFLQAGIALCGWPWTGVPFWMTIDHNQVKKEYGFEYLLSPPSPGDIIETKITQIANNQWQIYVTDVSEDWTPWTRVVTFQPDTTTAEWIHEPGANGSSIADFGSVTFQQAKLTVNGNTYKLGNIDPNQVQSSLFLYNMKRGAAIVTDVSTISSYERFTIRDTGKGRSSLSAITSMSLHSNATLSVYDQQGNRDGYNSTSGLVDMQIPNSLYFEDEDGAQRIILCQPDSYRVDVVGSSNGDFHLHEQVSDNDTITLDQWANETISINETKTYSLVHEIGVGSLASSNSFIGMGYSSFINVSAYNQGNYTETFNVTAYANATTIGTQLVTLTNGNSTILTFTWNTSGFAKGNYTISAYAEPVQGETDTADNVLAGGIVKVTIVGDVNGDDKVNLIDVFAEALAYGSYPGHPMWNPNYDINNDGKINLIDYFVTALNFGKSW